MRKSGMKLWIISLVVLIIVLLMCTFLISAEGIPPTTGDVNGDGKINVSDCVCIFEYDVGDKALSNEQLKIADVDNSGKVNKDDAILLAKYISRIVKELPEKTPDTCNDGEWDFSFSD